MTLSSICYVTHQLQLNINVLERVNSSFYGAVVLVILLKMSTRSVFIHSKKFFLQLKKIYFLAKNWLLLKVTSINAIIVIIIIIIIINDNNN